MFSFIYIVTIQTLFLLQQQSTFVAARQTAVFRLKNDSKGSVTLNWVHPDTEETVLMTEISPGASYSLDTFVGHEFELIENPSPATGECVSADKECGVEYHTITAGEHGKTPRQNWKKAKKCSMPFTP
jgi:hypothetical protein